MPRMFIDSRSDADRASSITWAPVMLQAASAISLPATLGEGGQSVQRTAAIIYMSLAGTGLEHDQQGAPDTEYEKQRDAFLAIPSAVLSQFLGEYVLSRDGKIVDHDLCLSNLTRRSVERFGAGPVYVTKVGGDLEASIDTPFLD